MKKATPNFAYKPAPAGSPDRYMLTAPAVVTWRGVPRRFFRLARCPAATFDGELHPRVDGDGTRCLVLRIEPPFWFSVSVAPDAPETGPAACCHDWIYSRADILAAWWRVPVRKVLALADHWFLALLRHYDFPYASLYFRGVSVFGYAFNRIAKWLRSLTA